MSLMDNLKTKKDIELDQDRVGGGGLLGTDVYGTTIKYAYLSQSAGGAIAINFMLETDDGGKVNQTTYMTSKTGSNTYADKNGGGEKYLPGFILANTMCLLSVGKEIGELDTEPKILNLYNFDEKKELPTEVPVLTDLTNQRIKAAVEHQVVDKKAKNDNGQYVATGETRENNEVVKFFRDRDNMTVTEITAQAEEANFMDVWLEKNKGEVINRAKGASAGGATKGAPAQSGGKTQASSQVKSLFQ